LNFSRLHVHNFNGDFLKSTFCKLLSLGTQASVDHRAKTIVFFSNFVPKTHRFWDIRLQKCRDLENRVRGPSRSLEMSPIDRAHMTSYWRSIVTMAVSRVDIQCWKMKISWS